MFIDGKIEPRKSFKDFYYFITFFPHLVAGPIMRAEQFFYQLGRRRSLNFIVFSEGTFLIIKGAFFKLVCGDNIGEFIRGHWNNYELANLDMARMLTLIVLYGAQIFYDFEGYSSIARGLAYFFGFRFPINFNFPYIANSFSDFWRRWHISLSNWLRDYVYIPLGGNRLTQWQTARNLFFVMVLVGLWHGANTTFLISGAIHGCFLGVESLLGLDKRDGVRAKFRTLDIFWPILVQMGVFTVWIFFRSESLDQVKMVFSALGRFDNFKIASEYKTISILLVPILIYHGYGYLKENGKIPGLGTLEKSAMGGILLALVLLCFGHSGEFIYFQF